MPIEITANGTTYFTGLQLPETRATRFAPFPDHLLLTRDQIRTIVEHPTRIPARQRFPAELWSRNQGQRGSCNGYAGAASLGRSRVRRGLERVMLSGEFLYAAINGGRDEGSGLDKGMARLALGVAPESMVAHEEYRWSAVSQDARDAAKRFAGHECYHVETEDQLASALAAGFDCVVAVHCGRSWGQLNDHGVQYADSGPGNHSVSIQDLRFRGNVIEFDMKNSHGQQYGTDGCAWLQWQSHFTQPVQFHYFYAIRSTGDDPSATNPPTIQS